MNIPDIPVYIINMPARKERQAAMVSLMARIGIERYVFVEPVRKDAIPPGYERLADVNRGYASLNATVASKIFSVQELIGGPFIVFEDDAIERVDAKDIQAHLAGIFADLSGISWDMVYLEYCMETCHSTPIQPSITHIRRADKPYCTAAMLYNSQSIPKIRACLASEGALLDFSYAACIKSGTLDSFVSSPALFAQDAAYGAGDLSHMDPGHIQWWLDFVIRMYPNDSDAASGPRLPACWNSREIFRFVRWTNVAVFLLVVALLLVVYKIRPLRMLHPRIARKLASS